MIGKKKGIFKTSVHFQNIIEEEVRQEPARCFVKYPFVEVRSACIDQLKKGKYKGKYYSDWAEWVVKKLRISGYSIDGEFSKEILSWYVFNTDHCDEDLFVRCIEFCISWWEKWPGSANFISKIIAGKFNEANVYLYHRIPSMEKIISSSLEKMVSAGSYTDYNWHMCERALKIIELAKDIGFLSKIGDAIMKLSKGTIFPHETLPPYTKDMHLVRLRYTCNVLLRAKHEMEKTKSEGVFIREGETDLKGSFFINPA